MPRSGAAASRVATPQIRNVGTLGGNLLQDSRCPYYRGPWYCYRAGGIQCDAHHGMNQEHAIFGGSRCYTVSPSDTAPALIALGAAVRIHGAAPRECRCRIYSSRRARTSRHASCRARRSVGSRHGARPPRNPIDLHQVRDAERVGLRHRQRRGGAARRGGRRAMSASCSAASRPSPGGAWRRNENSRAAARCLDDRVRGAGSHCGGSSPRAQRIQGRAGQERSYTAR